MPAKKKATAITKKAVRKASAKKRTSADKSAHKKPAKKPVSKKGTAQAAPKKAVPKSATTQRKAARRMPCDCEAHAELHLDARMPRGFKPTSVSRGGAKRVRAGVLLAAAGRANWRVARSLSKLRDQVNLQFPERKKDCDGTIGDTRHQVRSSDHNPWVDWDGSQGVVTALDITHDTAHGCDCNLLAEALRSSRDSRIKYIIWNRRIANHAPVRGVGAWEWRSYGGSNPHTAHMHLSVKAERAKYDDESAWAVSATARVDEIRADVPAGAGPVPGWPKWEAHFASIPFGDGSILSDYNKYAGLYPDSLRGFAGTAERPKAISYATKFTVDGDGSGGAQPGDEDPRPDTSLHYHDAPTWARATALNSLVYAFAVIPGESATRPKFADLGIGLGDIGIAFFGRGKVSPFIYGDVGPKTKVGEGSIKMAKLLGMDWPPFMNSSAATGGFTLSEMNQFAPGVVHVAFPGSRDRSDRMTDLLTHDQLAAAAWALFERWIASFGP